MMAAALFAVLATAKAIAIFDQPLARSVWTPAAYLWQDAALATAFAAFELTCRRRPRLTASLYGLGAIYIATTLPVVRVLGTPLTVPMWRAAGGALSDSIFYYATVGNIIAILATLAIATAAPRLTRRISPIATAAALLPLVVLGSMDIGRIDTYGLDRNAWTALAMSALPRVAAESRRLPSNDWRAPLADDEEATDLSWLRGAASNRNIVLVGLESSAAQYLGLYGTKPDIAPNLTRLAQSAIVFDRAYAVYPESIKGLFATLCSKYPAFDRPAEILAQAPCQSPAEVLAAHGYHTGLFHAGRFAYLGMNGVIRNRGYDVLADAGEIGGNRESSFGVDEPAVVDYMLRWLDRLKPGERFFITYLPIAGHHPYESATQPPLFPGRTEFDRYRNAVHDGDAALGSLIDGIRGRGLERQTMWLVYGDHGEAFGQHPGNYGHTFQLYDENVRVPLLASLPGTLTQPIRSRRIVSLIDAAPTLLDLAGISAPVHYEGQSALSGPRRMSLFFADYSLALLGLRDGPNKFVYELESGRSRLFDLRRDPEERHNLAAERPSAAAKYAQRLTRWIKAASGGFERTATASRPD